MDNVNVKLEAFVNRYLPECVENVKQLQGGHMNHTFRLHLKSELHSIPPNMSNDDTLLTSIHRLKPKSLVVKIAYSSMADCGKDAPFSTYRQQVEEAGLKLFNKSPLDIDDTKSNSVDLSSILERNKAIKVPRVHFRDVLENILVIEDFGPFQIIDEWVISEKLNSLSTESKIVASQAYGEQLGNFLVDMQMSSLPYIDQLKLLTGNPQAHERLVGAVHRGFEKLRDSYGLADADELFSICNGCLQYDLSCAPTDGQVLAHGDFHPSNILIDDEKSILAILDWELAAVRLPAFDPARLLGFSRALLVTNPTNSAMINFINGFMDAYRESAKRNDVSWFKNEREQYLFAWYLGAIYGTTMIRLVCLQTCCPTRDEICCHRRDILAIGADAIRNCRLGPEKGTYDSVSHDSFLGRIFQGSNSN